MTDYCYSADQEHYSDELAEHCDMAIADGMANEQGDVVIWRAAQVPIKASDLINFNLYESMCSTGAARIGEAIEHFEVGDSEQLQKDFLAWVDANVPDPNVYGVNNVEQITCRYVFTGPDSEGWDIIDVQPFIKP